MPRGSEAVAYLFVTRNNFISCDFDRGHTACTLQQESIGRENISACPFSPRLVRQHRGLVSTFAFHVAFRLAGHHNVTAFLWHMFRPYYVNVSGSILQPIVNEHILAHSVQASMAAPRSAAGWYVRKPRYCVIGRLID